jgi:hypothetical protein
MDSPTLNNFVTDAAQDCGIFVREVLSRVFVTEANFVTDAAQDCGIYSNDYQ